MGRKSILISLLMLCSIVSVAQFKVRPIQLGISPGISTNGINGGEYFNYFSLNLISGYNAGSLGFSASLFSNFSLHNSQGLQISGITNIVGGNRYVGMTKSEVRDLKKEDRSLFEAYFYGLQLTGIGNIVTGNQYGAQIAGLFNKVGNCQSGVQLAGLWNFVHDHSEGVQISGLMNLTILSHRGLQLSPLFNYAEQGVHGLQLSLFNKCGILQGRKSKNHTPISGFQIGLINKSRDSGGTQIGLINIASKSRGTQVGLINISSEREPSDRAVGLWNTASNDASIRITGDPLLPTSFSISHGTSYWQNEWIFGYAPVRISENFPKFKYGYSYERTKMIRMCGVCPVKKITAWGFSFENYRFSEKSKGKNLAISLKLQKAWLLKKGFYIMIGGKTGTILTEYILPLQLAYFKSKRYNINYSFNILPYIGILYM